MADSFFSGEEGLDFFLAGELDGDPSVSVFWSTVSWRRRGLFIPFSISLIFDESSWESRGCGGRSEVSIGVGRVDGRSSMGTGGGIGGYGAGGSGSGWGWGSGSGAGFFPFFWADERVFGAGVWDFEMGMVLASVEFRYSLVVWVN